MSETTPAVAVDHEKWGRLLYLLYRERGLYKAIRGGRWPTPEWDDLEPKERRAWVSDASEFIRAWEQKRQQMSDVLSSAVREEGRAEVRAAIEALCDDKWLGDRDRIAQSNSRAASAIERCATELRALLADDGAAALREHDRQVLGAAERRMFGTEDGDLIGEDSEVPAGELQRLLWEPYRDTAGEGT